ncbi:hypothetical protein V8C37DRAFT_288124 [Trichoderma ceciliae]
MYVPMQLVIKRSRLGLNMSLPVRNRGTTERRTSELCLFIERPAQMDLPKEGSKRRRGDQIPFGHITRSTERTKYVQYSAAVNPVPNSETIPPPQYNQPETRDLARFSRLCSNFQFTRGSQAKRHGTSRRRWHTKKSQSHGGGVVQKLQKLSHTLTPLFCLSRSLWGSSIPKRSFALTHSLTHASSVHIHTHTRTYTHIHIPGARLSTLRLRCRSSRRSEHGLYSTAINHFSRPLPLSPAPTPSHLCLVPLCSQPYFCILGSGASETAVRTITTTVSIRTRRQPCCPSFT